MANAGGCLAPLPPTSTSKGVATSKRARPAASDPAPRTPTAAHAGASAAAGRKTGDATGGDRGSASAERGTEARQSRSTKRRVGERVADDRASRVGGVFRTERGGARADRRRARWRKTHLRRGTRAPRRTCGFRTERTSRDVPRSAREGARRDLCPPPGNVSAFSTSSVFQNSFP